MDPPGQPPEDAAPHVEARHQLVHLQHGPRVVAHRVLRRCLPAFIGKRPRQALPGQAAEHRHRSEQRAGVVAAGCIEHRDRLALLHFFAGAHHHHAIGDLGDHAHVMGDEQQRHAQLVLEGAHQPQHLRLHGDIERRGGFVGDQQPRAAGQCHGDHHPLPHAAGELERVAVELPRRFRDAHALEHAPRLLAAGRLPEPLVQHHRLGNLFADAQHRIEAGHRLLEDHGDLRAAQLAHPFLSLPRQVEHSAVARAEAHRAGVDPPARVVDQPRDCERGHRLARTGLADDGNGLPFGDPDVEAAHHLRAPPLALRKADGQPGDIEQGGVGVGREGWHMRSWVGREFSTRDDPDLQRAGPLQIARSR